MTACLDLASSESRALSHLPPTPRRGGCNGRRCRQREEEDQCSRGGQGKHSATKCTTKTAALAVGATQRYSNLRDTLEKDQCFIHLANSTALKVQQLPCLRDFHGNNLVNSSFSQEMKLSSVQYLLEGDRSLAENLPPPKFLR